MAKISARGATEVARIMVVNPQTKQDYIMVLCSDGRILIRPAGSKGTYTLLRRGVSHLTEGMLRQFALSNGYQPVRVTSRNPVTGKRVPSSADIEQARGRLETP